MPVLIVDDNATSRRILAGLFELWQARPVSAASTSQAMSLIRSAIQQKNPFKLVLADAHLAETDGFHLAAQIVTLPMPAPFLILMLHSGQQQTADLARCRDLGIARYLTKPVRREELKSLIADAFAGVFRDVGPLPEGPQQRQPARCPPRRILLAEDNMVNQRVALRLLEKAGHHVLAVANGKKALAAWLSQPFDLILMDVQMPEMDGIEATSEIRRAERGSTIHIPIIAVTAHAMSGDRERCLAAGMDDYLSKPLNKADLMEIIARHTQPLGRPEPSLT
jgi:CheY-like chemotaxis protein